MLHNLTIHGFWNLHLAVVALFWQQIHKRQKGKSHHGILVIYDDEEHSLPIWPVPPHFLSPFVYAAVSAYNQPAIPVSRSPRRVPSFSLIFILQNTITESYSHTLRVMDSFFATPP